MTCKKCGKELKENHNFCTNCGTKLLNTNNEISNKEERGNSNFYNNLVEKKDYHKLILSVAISIAALVCVTAVVYYFVFFLPSIQKEEMSIKRTDIEEQQYQRDVSLAQEVREDCIKSGQSVSDDFDINNTYSNPLFYPYDDTSSFHRNYRLLLAISSS